MTTDERIKLLHNYRAAHDEIVMLRRQVADLAPIARVVAIFEAALIGKPREQGYGEDIAWRLKKEVERIVEEREAEAAAKEPPHDPT